MLDEQNDGRRDETDLGTGGFASDDFLFWAVLKYLVEILCFMFFLW